MQEKLYTVTELARLFDVSRQTIYNWLEEGRFPNKFSAGEGKGSVTLIPASDVEAVRKEEAEKLIAELDRLGFQAVAA